MVTSGPQRPRPLLNPYNRIVVTRVLLEVRSTDVHLGIAASVVTVIQLLALRLGEVAHVCAAAVGWVQLGFGRFLGVLTNEIAHGFLR